VSPPIFIVGANRSGTTLLRLILNAHPRIAIPDELIYFDSRLAGIPIECWRQPDLSSSTYEAFVERFLKQNCAPLEELDKSALRKKILAGPHDLRAPYRCALRAWADHYGKARWGEKTPANLFYADIVLEMFPEAQFLYIVRDPRAGVASMQRVSFFPDDIIFNALSRRKHDIEGRRLLESSVPAKQIRTVHYENLVQDPESTMHSICSFLSEDYTTEIFRFHEEAGTYMKDEAERDYNQAATHPITDDRINAWQDSLTADQVAAIESLCAPIMRSFGYSPTGHVPPVPRRAEMFVKQAYWALQCWRHRDVRHYTVKHRIFARTRSRLAFLRDQMREGLRWISSTQSS